MKLYCRIWCFFFMDRITPALQHTVLTELVFRHNELFWFDVIKYVEIKTENLRLVVSDFCKSEEPIFDELPSATLMWATKIELEGPLKGFLGRMGFITKRSNVNVNELNFNVTNTDFLANDNFGPDYMKPIVIEYLENIWNTIRPMA